MEQGFIDILKKLTAEQGKQALLNPSKAKSFLADYVKGEYKKESRLFLQSLEVGAAKAIDAAADLALCKQQQIRALQDECFLVPEVAADLVDTLALVLRGDTSAASLPGKAQAGAPPKPGAAPAPQAAPMPPTAPTAADPNSEKDFNWDNDNFGAKIFEYEGKNKIVRIPTRLRIYPVVIIEIDAFRGKQLTSITFPSSLKWIKEGAFMDNQLTSVFIPNSVLQINDCAFINNQLSSVVIPDSVGKIGYCAFAGNQLSSVTVPPNADVNPQAFDPGVTVTKRKN